MPEIVCSRMVHLGESLRAAWRSCSLTAFGSASDYEARNSVSRLQRLITLHREQCQICSRLKPATAPRPSLFPQKKPSMSETSASGKSPERRSA